MADLENIKEIIGLPDHLQIHQLDPQNPAATLKIYTVLVNPESYSTSHSVSYKRQHGFQSGRSTVHYNHSLEDNLSIQLLFDATGSLGSVPILNKQNVLEQINYFLDVAFVDKGQSCGDGKPLKLVWGPMEFHGLLESVNITYSHFDATGMPIRATANCTFIEGSIQFQVKEKKRKKKKTPKAVDFAKQKHAINAVLKYGSYMAVVSQQPRSAMPKSLRIAEQIIRMII